MDPYVPLADVYEDWSARMTEDIPFYVELAREADGPVVELAVGSGRVAVPAARVIGRRVIGIDASPTMLAKARAAADAAGIELEWWATKNERLGLIDVAGLEVQALYGWFDRSPFAEDSREYVWVARKPG